jgi:hypothetical protein
MVTEIKVIKEEQRTANMSYNRPPACQSANPQQEGLASGSFGTLRRIKVDSRFGN